MFKNDLIKVLAVDDLNLKGVILDRNLTFADSLKNAVSFHKEKIESTFTQNEYLKWDLTHREIVGLKSDAEIVTYVYFKDKGESHPTSMEPIKVGDLVALDFVLRNSEKYKDAEMINLGNVNDVFQKTEEKS